MTFTTRFAPSPTGPLHLGHAYSALCAFDMARAQHGQFLLRIEDIDQSRARAQWETLIYEDLQWLGLDWPRPVLRQSDRLNVYSAALDTLWARGFLYPCHCNRKDISQAASAPQEGAPLVGPDGIVYPGTCRPDVIGAFAHQTRPTNTALRLDLRAVPNKPLCFTETGTSPDGQSGDIACTIADLQRTVGDMVLARRDMGTSYHLSVVLDDAEQDITHAVRGQDLFDATHIHVLLQTLMGLPTPIYHHHRLVRDESGKRLAKRDDARALSIFRADGKSPTDIRAMIGLTAPKLT